MSAKRIEREPTQAQFEDEWRAWIATVDSGNPPSLWETWVAASNATRALYAAPAAPARECLDHAMQRCSCYTGLAAAAPRHDSSLLSHASMRDDPAPDAAVDRAARRTLAMMGYEYNGGDLWEQRK